MSLFRVFDVAGSALSAQSARLNLVSSNLANADAVSSSIDQTYRARHPVFQTVDVGDPRAPSAGVQVAGVVESQAELVKEYRPEHPMADEAGYIFRSNVNVVDEMADMISASRTFETNVEVINTSKQLLLRTLALGQ